MVRELPHVIETAAVVLTQGFGRHPARGALYRRTMTPHDFRERRAEADGGSPPTWRRRAHISTMGFWRAGHPAARSTFLAVPDRYKENRRTGHASIGATDIHVHCDRWPCWQEKTLVLQIFFET